MSYFSPSLRQLLISTIMSCFPLDSIEQNTQPELLVILPKLGKDLLDHKTDTLCSFTS